ncbi:MAG: hypothetical protein V1661_01760 [bacterium]
MKIHQKEDVMKKVIVLFIFCASLFISSAMAKKADNISFSLDKDPNAFDDCNNVLATIIFKKENLEIKARLSPRGVLDKMVFKFYLEEGEIDNFEILFFAPQSWRVVTFWPSYLYINDLKKLRPDGKEYDRPHNQDFVASVERAAWKIYRDNKLGRLARQKSKRLLRGCFQKHRKNWYEEYRSREFIRLNTRENPILIFNELSK